MPPITNPFARITGSMPPLIPKPEAMGPPPPDISMPDNSPIPAFPSSPAPKIVRGPFDPATASPEELAMQPLTSALRRDEAKDIHPWGTPENHPGFLGKFGHALSVIAGVPYRRQQEEMGLQKSLQDLLGSQSRNQLQGAQAQNFQSEIAQRNKPPATVEQTAKWKPLLGGNGQIVTAPGGKLIEVSDAGDVRAIDLPENTNIGLKPSGANGAFQQWMQNPEKYEDFQKTMAELKAQVAAEHPHQAANSSFMNVYAAQRFLQMAYNDNPALLPVASKMIGKLLNLSPDETSTMAQVPLDQPLSPVTHEPIGRLMPSAPTPGTRVGAQNAEKFLSEYPRITADVNAAANDLGPVQGRAVMGFLLGNVGSTGDPEADRKLSKLRTDLTFVGSNAAKFHINSVRQAEMFDKLAGQNKSTAPAIQGFLDSIKSWAETSANQQRGHGEQGGQKHTESTNTEAPEGTVVRTPEGNMVKHGGKWVKQ